MSGGRSYIPALDGLRALAVGAVVVSHTWTSLLPGGWAGVDVFFVLSGYLITSLLLAEHRGTGRVRCLDFYARRARRLLPALGMTLALGMCLAIVALPTAVAATQHEALAAAAYSTNWWIVFGEGTIPHGVLSHTWSLSIEEQFYFVWPLLLIVMLRVAGVRTAFWMALGLIVLVAVHRFSVAGPPAYYRFDTRADTLLIGCAVALAAELGWFTKINRSLLRALGVAGGALLACDVAFSPATDFTLTAIAAAILVVIIAERRLGVARIFEARALVWLGKRSYGIYLYHFPILVALVEPRLGIGPLTMAATVALTLVCATLSYRYVERPLLRRTRSRPVAARTLVAAAA
jgi:peptidoglycan/LPS O-acetylase OafA/YrhL